VALFFFLVNWGVVVRDPAVMGVKETIFSVLKVPRQCSLALLIGVRLVFRINSIFFINFNVNGVGGAVLERNLVRH
jgi:hypothetical protein